MNRDRNPLERIVKSSIDLIVLGILAGAPGYGYKIIAEVHKRYGVLLSPGTLYPLLQDLKRNGFVTGYGLENKKVYNLTDDGHVYLQGQVRAYRRLVDDTWRILEGSMKLRQVDDEFKSSLILSPQEKK